MHIPDGYLGPQTYVPTYAAMVPIWALASSRLKKTLRQRQTPLLALGAAFSFLIMMFNVPIPGGTTGHAVGAVLVAILLGPWAATMAVSLALIVQALLFGDGGITAIGANCFNMAVIMPWTGWAVYRLIAGSSVAASKCQWIGAAIGGYVGLNAAALATGVMFGIQPMIGHGADGRALYCPYGLSVAVPVMAGEHLLVFGFVEAIVTGLVVAYLQRIAPSMIPAAQTTSSEKPRRLLRGAVTALLVMIFLTPLGLYLPAKLGAGSAWGEWSSEELSKLAGYVPRKFARLESTWKAPLPDYALAGQEDASLPRLSIYYVLSGVIGAAVVVIVSLGVGRMARKNSIPSPPTDRRGQG